MVEIEDAGQLRRYIDQHQQVTDVVVQGVNLAPFADELRSVPVHGSVFLACGVGKDLIADLLDRGALAFPSLPDLPYLPYRPRLYTPKELMEGYVRGTPESFETKSLDGRIYAHYKSHRDRRGKVPVLEALGQRMHDHAIDDALADLLAEEAHQRVVAVMGGHAMKRSDPEFLAVARLAATLTQRGYFLVSGGGPGAMEATNLGAYLAQHLDALPEVVNHLSVAPGYRDDGWFESAFEILEQYPTGSASLGVPTWFYGHEPSNLFATHLAKYFSNSLREDGLIAMASHGVIYAPGSAGTLQEVFMDAAQNHYATTGEVSPMVFLGRSFWLEKLPAYSLLRRLAGERAYAEMLTVVDDVEEVVAFLEEHPPVRTTP
ncbi:MAG: hypothetical protein AAGA48_09245 [Myxococcota bacterium]